MNMKVKLCVFKVVGNLSTFCLTQNHSYLTDSTRSYLMEEK